MSTTGSVESRETRRESAVDTMASWSLEGMEADSDTIIDIRAYVEGSLSIEEFIEKTRAL
ncbi:hypothetical protein GCM10027416_14490 [Okibacterium endophyticum]